MYIFFSKLDETTQMGLNEIGLMIFSYNWAENGAFSAMSVGRFMRCCFPYLLQWHQLTGLSHLSTLYHWEMKLLLLNYRAFLSTPVALTSVRRAFSAAAAPFSASKWEGGVAMVQGASRGIGLEFVSWFSSF